MHTPTTIKRFMLCLVLSILLGPTTALPDYGNVRSLKFFHTHTHRMLDVTYFRDGAYVPEAAEQLKIFLADWRDGKQKEVDMKLMDILWRIQQKTGNRDRYEVISAYRSPETNRLLRSRSNGVAKRSQHLEGKAIDVRLRGLDTKVLRNVAIAIKKGGVGYYEKSDFVHIDTGRVRKW